ncbi:hypothetical protein MOTE_20120 [Moorella thermoacetica]|uniref:Uncharacterized protein n=1 Tax=Neomoorella thermoacetica TaxID=1525 RepID=A0A1J5P327_NEOTH|nr:hypothetical protein MOTE_20120 [Moorella thermoacetica]
MGDCELRFTSLRLADAPMSAMAAYGLLRIATEEPEFQGPPFLNAGTSPGANSKLKVFLKWEKDSWRRDHYAVLVFRGEALPPDCRANFLQALHQVLERRAKYPLSLFTTRPPHNLQIPEEIKEISKRERQGVYDRLFSALKTDSYAPLYALFALGRWIIGRKGEKKFKDTPLLTYAGQVDPFGTYKSVLDYLEKEAKKNPQKLGDSLFGGHWSFLDRVKSFRFHPAIVQEDAYISYEASGKKLPTEAIGEWLAFESLPLYVTYLTRSGRDIVLPGVVVRNGDVVFRFPVWHYPISLPVLRSLLHLVVAENLALEQFGQYGITGIYEVAQYRVGKGEYRSVATPVVVL